MADIDELADAIGSAVETGETARLATYFAPDAVVWHDIDHQEIDVPAAMAGIAMLSQVATDVRVEVVRRAALPDGFVQQFVIRGVMAGKPFEMHNCLVVTVADGRIVRMDEYVDANALAAL